MKSLEGPWLLYDNQEDPYQIQNLVDLPAYRDRQADLERRLANLLDDRKDRFEPGEIYIQRRGYQVNKNGTLPYS